MKEEPTEPTLIRSVEDFIARVLTDSEGWPYAWFRGEPGHVNTTLLPRRYRPRSDGTRHNMRISYSKRFAYPRGK